MQTIIISVLSSSVVATALTVIANYIIASKVEKEKRENERVETERNKLYKLLDDNELERYNASTIYKFARPMLDDRFCKAIDEGYQNFKLIEHTELEQDKFRELISLAIIDQLKGE